MKLIREHLNEFIHHQDPVSSLGLGHIAIIRDGIKKIFQNDHVVGLGNIMSCVEISPTGKRFLVVLDGEYFIKHNGKVLNKKNYTIDLVHKAGLSEYFFDVSIDYKHRGMMIYRVKEEFIPYFKQLRGMYHKNFK